MSGIVALDGGDGVEDAGFDAELDQLINSSVYNVF